MEYYNKQSPRNLRIFKLNVVTAQIAAAGRILLANTLSLKSHQKTFSLATSRDMVPEARIVVFCVLPDGEILSDSLNFYVDGIKGNDVSLFLCFKMLTKSILTLQ